MINNLITSVRSKYQTFRRMIFWGWNLRNSWDFDAQTIYDILYLKLQRLYVVFNQNGHLVWNSSPDNKRMRKLSEAILLCKRIKEDYHENNMFADLEQRFGEVKMEFIPQSNGFSKMKLERSKVSTELQRLAYSQELKKAFNKANKLKKADEDRLFKLLRENINVWWD